ncbi:MAG: hypothetical protein K0V04_25240, partial [Deltaproteobacteria bacterium]|nr:hypothetical protein [Deltaproteobacteria bacterium]
LWSACPESDKVASIGLGDIQAFHLDEHRVDPVESAPVVYRPAVLREIEADLAAQVGRTCGPLLANAYDPDFTPYRALYPNALALVVLAHGAEATGDADLLTQTAALAEGVAALSRKDGRLCAWPLDMGCNDIVLDDELCSQWIGDQAWAGLALVEARRVLHGSEPSPYDAAIDGLIAWTVAAAGENAAAGGPGVFGASTEGTIDAWLFLAHAVRAGDTVPGWRTLSPAIIADLETRWDVQDQRLLIGPNHHHAALDVTANLGTLLWRSLGDESRAMASGGTAAALFATRSFDGEVMGMGDMTGPWTVNGEWGVGQYAASGGPHSELVVREFIESAYKGGRAWAGLDPSFVGFLSWSNREPWLASTAWLYLAIEGQQFPALRTP